MAKKNKKGDGKMSEKVNPRCNVGLFKKNCKYNWACKDCSQFKPKKKEKT